MLVTMRKIYYIFSISLTALLLTSPNADKTGAFMTANEVENFYLNRGKDIFKGNFILSRSVRSLAGNIYDVSGLEKLITDLVGNRKYNTSLIPILLTGF